MLSKLTVNTNKDALITSGLTKPPLLLRRAAKLEEIKANYFLQNQQLSNNSPVNTEDSLNGPTIQPTSPINQATPNPAADPAVDQPAENSIPPSVIPQHQNSLFNTQTSLLTHYYLQQLNTTANQEDTDEMQIDEDTHSENSDAMSLVADQEEEDRMLIDYPSFK